MLKYRQVFIAAQFLAGVLSQDKKALLSREHFSVDGTLLEALASLKSFQPKGRLGRTSRPWTQWRAGLSRRPAEQHSHVSTTDPEARLFRKGPGKEARLCFIGHALMENRNGLIVGAVTHNRFGAMPERVGGAGADRASRRDPAAGHARWRHGL